MAASPIPPSPSPLIVDGAPSRLDLYLVEKTGRSRMFLKEQIEAGNVLVNGAPVSKTSLKVRAGDEVTFRFKEERPLDLEPVQGDLRVLFEDESLLVLNKLQGQVVHPAAGHRGETLVHFLLHHLRNHPGFSSGDSDRPGIVHRLDRGTSGVLLVAKNRQIQEALSAQFKARSVKKEYEAVAWGKLGDKGVWKSEIGRDNRDRKKMSSKTAKGRASVTHWQRVRAFGHFTHVALFPHTGRTHQLRVHLAEAGFPIVGDALYGRGATTSRSRGLSEEILARVTALEETLLHARKLAFTHPVSGEALSFEAERPEIFTEFLKLLERQDP
jgi:23S rRNA pseudouridine1911/1915/1917 synthase